MNKITEPLIAYFCGYIGLAVKISIWFDNGDRKFDLNLKRFIAHSVITFGVVTLILLHGLYQEGWSSVVVYQCSIVGGFLGSKAIGVLIKMCTKIDIADK